jgi:hypothetical protein
MSLAGFDYAALASSGGIFLTVEHLPFMGIDMSAV